MCSFDRAQYSAVARIRCVGIAFIIGTRLRSSRSKHRVMCHPVEIFGYYSDLSLRMLFAGGPKCDTATQILCGRTHLGVLSETLLCGSCRCSDLGKLRLLSSGMARRVEDKNEIQSRGLSGGPTAWHSVRRW